MERKDIEIWYRHRCNCLAVQKPDVLNPVTGIMEVANMPYCRDINHSCQCEHHSPVGHWYDGLCVEVTLADMLPDTGTRTVGMAVNVAANVAGNFWAYGEYSASCWARAPEKYAINTESGIALMRAVPRNILTPHSIVELVCPPFAEACEHPEEFVAMAKELKTHEKKSDMHAWNRLCLSMSKLCATLDEWMKQ